MYFNPSINYLSDKSPSKMREIENFLRDIINKNKYVELLNSVPQPQPNYNPNHDPNRDPNHDLNHDSNHDPNHDPNHNYATAALVVGALALISFAFGNS